MVYFSRTCTALLSLVLVLTVSPPSMAGEDQCVLWPVKIGSGNPLDRKLFQAPNGRFEILFHKPDAQNPAVADSEDFEIISKETKKSCIGSAPGNADVSITTNQRRVVAAAYESDNKSLEFIDPETCKEGETLHWREGGVHFNANRITIDAGCGSCTEAACFCEPAQIIELRGDACQPHLQGKESRKLTKAQLRVEMTQPSFVSNPKTYRAKIVKEQPDSAK